MLFFCVFVGLRLCIFIRILVLRFFACFQNPCVCFSARLFWKISSTDGQCFLFILALRVFIIRVLLLSATVRIRCLLLCFGMFSASAGHVYTPA